VIVGEELVLLQKGCPDSFNEIIEVNGTVKNNIRTTSAALRESFNVDSVVDQKALKLGDYLLDCNWHRW
jgi:hypothetical protein